MERPRHPGLRRRRQPGGQSVGAAPGRLGIIRLFNFFSTFGRAILVCSPIVMRISSPLRWKLDWLLAAALLLRALIPAGFMPVSLASGLLFDLCPASNPGWVMAAGMHAEHHPHAGMKHDPKAGEAQQCPIGLMLVPALALTAPWHFELTPLAPPPVETTVHSWARIHPPLYQSRGPPA